MQYSKLYKAWCWVGTYPLTVKEGKYGGVRQHTKQSVLVVLVMLWDHVELTAPRLRRRGVAPEVTWTTLHLVYVRVVNKISVYSTASSTYCR